MAQNHAGKPGRNNNGLYGGKAGRSGSADAETTRRRAAYRRHVTRTVGVGQMADAMRRRRQTETSGTTTVEE